MESYISRHRVPHEEPYDSSIEPTEEAGNCQNYLFDKTLPRRRRLRHRLYLLIISPDSLIVTHFLLLFLMLFSVGPRVQVSRVIINIHGEPICPRLCSSALWARLADTAQ
jgi:hypothetical protein